MKHLQVPNQMIAALWRGGSKMEIETIPVPEIHGGELLIQVRELDFGGKPEKKSPMGKASLPWISCSSWISSAAVESQRPLPLSGQLMTCHEWPKNSSAL